MSFPTDETTLTLLIAACEINPDSGHTELERFLDMGTQIRQVTNEKTGETYSDMDSALADIDEDEVPVFFVEHEKGYAPFSPHDVIKTLARELLALRTRVGVGA